MSQVLFPVAYLNLPVKCFFFFASVFPLQLCRCQANISLGLEAEYFALNKLPYYHYHMLYLAIVVQLEGESGFTIPHSKVRKQR